MAQLGGYTSQPVTIGKQIHKMRDCFPGLKLSKERGWYVWRGPLQPTINGPKYKIKLLFKIRTRPDVWITSPNLVEGTPHIYSDQRLCLYYPNDHTAESWSYTSYLADTIIPWTCKWLKCYELWRYTGEWFADEVIHSGFKL